MSDAIYCATRNFSSAFQTAAKFPYNPTRAVRLAAGAVALAAIEDEPAKNLYRNSIPVHLTKMALLGPRGGAKAGALAARKLVQTCKTPTVRFEVVPSAVSRPSVVGRFAGLGGALVGGVLGVTFKSSLHVGVAGLFLGATLVGAAIGCAGIPVAGVYALYVAASRKKRQKLRATRQELNASAAKALGLENAPTNDLQFYQEAGWENVVKSPGKLSPVRTGRD